MAVLLANIGNTHVELALCEGQEFIRVETRPTAELLAGRTPSLLSDQPEVPLLAACVVPEFKTHWASPERRIIWLNAEMDLGIDFSPVDNSTLGADRVANAVAASAELELPAIILDCGTAVTTEILDEQRRFLGGAILPGRRLTRQALAAGTGQLPLIDLTDSAPPVLGANTQEALRAGIDSGLLGGVDRILRETRKLLTGPVTVLAVGGDREFFAANLEGVGCGPADFTLRGLAHAAQRLGLN